jgi:hypothetical protein
LAGPIITSKSVHIPQCQIITDTCQQSHRGTP